MTERDDVAAAPQASGSGPGQRLSLADLANAVKPPTKGGEEVRIGGFWAVKAEGLPMTDTLTLWRAELCGIPLQAAAATADGPVYARPFGRASNIDPENDEYVGDPVAYVVGVELVHEDGSSCGWSLELVPPWIVGPLAEGKERSDPSGPSLGLGISVEEETTWE